MLNVKDLCVGRNGVDILNGVDFDIGEGEVVALMGQNGSGKSTLAQVLMGNPGYEIVGGSINYRNENILSKSPNDRSTQGIFLAFQYPYEIPGLKVGSYLRFIYNNSHNENIPFSQFRRGISKYLKMLNLSEDILKRYLNDGFSGGEKKRMEVLQMFMLDPKLVILDEIDSGLDVDAIKHVAKAVNYICENRKVSILLITHYARIFKYIKPNRVLIMEKGRIVREGNAELAHDIEEKGYEKVAS